MTDRRLSTELEIINLPNKYIKFLKSCDNYSNSLSNRFLSLTVKLKNFNVELPNRTIYLIISLVNELEQLIEYPVPNFLYSCDKKIRYENKILGYSKDCICIPFDTQSMLCEIKNFQIIKNSKREISEQAENFIFTGLIKHNQTYDMETFFNQSKNMEEILMNQQQKCRLKLQAIIYNNLEKKFEHFLTEPIYSDPIIDSYEILNENADSKSNLFQLMNTDVTNLENIRILRSSRMEGSFDGGDEMFLFTTYFDPIDLMVEFFQLNTNGDVGWKSYASFNKCDSHVNFALVVQTPRYISSDLAMEKNQKVKVYFRLFRPSKNDYSEKWSFYYVKKINNTLVEPISIDEISQLKFKSLNLNSGIKRKIEEKCDAEIINQNDVNYNKKKILKSEKLSDDNKSDDKNSDLNEEKIEERASDVNLIENVCSNMANTSNQAKIIEKFEKFDQMVYQKKIDDYCSKMNNLADRTGQSLLKFSKTRSLHDLLKTQRFLFNFSDENGNCPLHLSIIYKNFDLLEIFVDVIMTIPHQNIINLRNKAGFTPLLIAVHLGEIELCEFLLEANADLSLSDFDGNNPIHLACKHNKIELLKVLIKYVDRQHNYGVLNAINHEGYAPIHLATVNRSFEMVRELLYFKTLRINIPDKKLGYSALHYAVIGSSSYKIAELLVKNEKVDLNCKSHSGCTPLHLAVANRNYFTTILLLRSGADPNIQNDYPIHIDYDSMQYFLIRDLKSLEDFLKKKTLSSKDIDLDTKFVGQELIKFGTEVKRIFEPHLKSCIELEPKSKNFNHNHDPLAYAESDIWVFIFFSKTRSFLI